MPSAQSLKEKSIVSNSWQLVILPRPYHMNRVMGWCQRCSFIIPWSVWWEFWAWLSDNCTTVLIYLHLSFFYAHVNLHKLLKLVKTSSKVFKLVQNCSNLFKHVQKCSNLFRNLLKHVCCTLDTIQFPSKDVMRLSKQE